MMKVLSRQLDDRRRVVLPESAPPFSSVTIQPLDEETWLVRLAKPETGYKVVLIPTLDKLPDDPEWEVKEAQAAAMLAKNFPAFET